MKTSIFQIIILLLCSLIMLEGQSVIGIWESYHPEDNSPVAHIEIYEVNGAVNARVINLLDDSLMSKCEKCPGAHKNQSLNGMDVIWELKRKSDSYYMKGRILDPTSGKVYKCFVKLKDDNLLKVRAYMGIRTLGKTQYWSRLNNAKREIAMENISPN